jgi:hypothetical protein
MKPGQSIFAIIETHPSVSSEGVLGGYLLIHGEKALVGAIAILASF